MRSLASNLFRLAGLPAGALLVSSACSELPSFGDGSVGIGGMGGRSGSGGSRTTLTGVGDAGSSSTGSTSSSGGSTGSVTECGDGIIQSPETCEDDDKSPKSDDGCSSECQVEGGYACPVPGAACVQLAVCGDGSLGPGEECDDTNARSGDGCTDLCFVEIGWECPLAGSRCTAIGCGDGIVAGNEQCEDNDTTPTSGDGCSESCRVEPGYFCTTEGEACEETVCGNGVREGDEPCDDGNGDVGDGCTPLCEREPTCPSGAGACTSTCGDGIILSGDGEACDDGNVLDGDGCSSTCQEESGYECTLVTGDPPDELVIPVIYRDFIGEKVSVDRYLLDATKVHPDFNAFSGSGTTDLVLSTLLDGKPQYAGICDATDTEVDAACPDGQQLTTEANFDQWFTDGPKAFRVDDFLTLDRNAGGQYVFDSGSGFFPLTGRGWQAEGEEEATDSGGHNYNFTTELRYFFELAGGEVLNFSGDDDVWVFINNQLLIDLGGMHGEKSDTITLDDALIASLGMEKGKIYEVVLFQAERRQTGSNFKLTLNGFVATQSSCEADCGDGIVAGDEVCDSGDDAGGYGECLPDCSGLAQRCGDNEIQSSEGEVCDDGVNLTAYDFSGDQGADSCAPGCVGPAYCGDGNIDVAYGEHCDDGNLDDGDGCESNCTFRTECGDGNIDSADGETCDDGNRKNGDGCSQFCTVEVVVVR